MTGEMAGDVPAMVAGSMGGGAAGAMALPAAIKEGFKQYRESGGDMGFDQWFSVIKEGVKGAVVGKAFSVGGEIGQALGDSATSVVGKAIGGAGGRVAGELTGMGVGTAATEGKLPTWEELVLMGIPVGVLHGVAKLTHKTAPNVKNEITDEQYKQINDFTDGDLEAKWEGAKKPANETKSQFTADEIIAAANRPRAVTALQKFNAGENADARIRLTKEPPMEEPGQNGSALPVGVKAINQAREELRAAENELSAAHDEWRDSGGSEDKYGGFEKARLRVESARSNVVRAVNDFGDASGDISALIGLDKKSNEPLPPPEEPLSNPSPRRRFEETLLKSWAEREEPLSTKYIKRMDDVGGLGESEPLEVEGRVEKEFVKSPRTGDVDLGVIDEDTGKAIGQEPAPIRLTREVESHIVKQRGKLLEEPVADFVADVAENYTHIYQGHSDRLLLVKRNGKDKLAVVELEPGEAQGFYKVITAYNIRKNSVDNKGAPLWERAQSNPLEGTGTSLHSADSGHSGTPEDSVRRRSEPSLPGSGPDTHLWPPGDASLSPSSKESPDWNGPSDKGQNNSSINIRPEPGNIKDSDESPRPPTPLDPPLSGGNFAKGEPDNPLSNERGAIDLRKRDIYNDEVRPHIKKRLAELNRQGDELRRRLGQAGSGEDRVNLKAEIKANGEAIERYEDTQKVLRQHEVDRGEQEKRDKFNLKKYYSRKLAEWVDRSGNVKAALREMGSLGQRAERDFVLQAGAPASAKRAVDDAFKKIYGGLPPSEVPVLSDLLESRRTATIDRYRDDILHPGGLKGKQHENAHSVLGERVKGFDRLNARADEYFSVTKDLARQLHEHGLLTDKAYDALVSKGDYMKRAPAELLDIFDPESRTEELDGKKMSIRDSGVKRLAGGTVGGLEKDSRKLLAELILSTHTRIARNEANKSLYELGRKQPGNGLVTIAEQIGSSADVKKQNLDKVAKWAQDRVDALTQAAEGIRGRLSQSSMSAKDMGKWAIEKDKEKARIQKWLAAQKKEIDGKYFAPEFAPPPKGHTLLNVVVDGETKGMYMPDEMANEWTTLDPAIASGFSNTLELVMGTKLLKVSATGANPEFFETNMPRDAARTWMVTTEYSPHLPVGIAQMAADYARVAKDVFRRDGKGRLADYINEGGGMELLAHEGRGSVLGNPVLKGLFNLVSWTGEKSELWTRLALRERAFNNMRKAGRTDTVEMGKDATFIARDQMDFSQGGRYAKGLNWVAFLNASIQGTRGDFRAAAKTPGVYAYKAAQLVLAGTIIEELNRQWNAEAYKNLSDYEKQNYWIFVLPEALFPVKIDEGGNKRWSYLRIAKDQMQRVFAAIGQTMVGITHGEKPDFESVARAAGNMIPLNPDQGLAPSVQAFSGYAANKDFFHGTAIWKGRKGIEPKEEYTAATNPAWVKFGQVTGLSPVRSQYFASQFITGYNPLVGLFGSGLGKMVDTLDGKERRAVSDQIVRDNPLFSRLVRHTQPVSPKEMQRAKEINIKHNTADYKVHRDFLEVLRGYDQNKNYKAVTDFVYDKNKVAPEHRKALMEDFAHWQRMSRIKSFTEKSWWLDLRSSSPSARAEIYWEKYKEAEPAKQKDMQRLLQQIPGIRTERFMRDLGRLQRGR